MSAIAPQELTAVQAAVPPASRPAESALRLLQHEAEVRRLAAEDDLLFHLANQIGSLLPCGQVMVWQRHRSAGQFRLRVVSGLADVDRDAPLVQALERGIARLDTERRLAEPLVLDTTELGEPARGRAEGGDADPALADYPHGHAMWLPLKDRTLATDAGALFTRETPFTAGEQTLLKRLAETYAHAWAALPVQRGFGFGTRITRVRLLLLLGALSGAGLIPVRLSVMAPVEVVAEKPFVVTAPINGVIRAIVPAPNSLVKAGQPLVQFEDIQPRNEMVLAQQRLAVARARDGRTGAAAFKDVTAAHDMAIARAEFDLAAVSYDYAVQVLDRTRIVAPNAGLVIYTDRRDWEGRAVMVGEEILQVADPGRVLYRVDVATGNSIQLDPEAEIGIFLDSAPLGGLGARLQSVSYASRTGPGGASSYTVLAAPTDGDAPRIGARGTARLYGKTVPLAVQLLRRPVAVFRQAFGL